MTPFESTNHDRPSARLRRISALVRKEGRQVIRDPSSIAIGVVLPVILVLLFGYGLSLDVLNVPVAVVLEDTSPAAVDLAAGFEMSPYFSAHLMNSMSQARELMLDRKVDGIVRIRSDFSRRLMLGDAEVQILIHGTEANRARIIKGYAEGTIGQRPAARTRARTSLPAPCSCRTGCGSTTRTKAAISWYPALLF
jgi:ABC-2 type transport system permease protein